MMVTPEEMGGGHVIWGHALSLGAPCASVQVTAAVFFVFIRIFWIDVKVEALSHSR